MAKNVSLGIVGSATVEFNLSVGDLWRSSQMKGDGFLIIAIAALAAYMGSSWERARRAIFDVRMGRQRVSRLRETAFKERFNAILIVSASLVVIFMIVRYR
ncbi:hypothetical protein [Spirillospora sp. CA-294931]|uniref:hypothetical protein n=1 Tax=Spirillospora sp. CA-294931 TaxID=3240042 RepID=UPI003D8E4381